MAKNWHFKSVWASPLNDSMSHVEAADRRRWTHLYCMVSEVVEALSLVIRILTMLKRKTKFIWGKATRATIITGSFVIASCTYTQFPAAGTLIMSGRGRGTSLSSFSKQGGVWWDLKLPTRRCVLLCNASYRHHGACEWLPVFLGTP